MSGIAERGGKGRGGGRAAPPPQDFDRHRSKTFLFKRPPTITVYLQILKVFKRPGLLFVPSEFSNLPTALKMRLRKP